MGDFSTEKLFLFALFALPGAIAIRVYALWCPVQQKDWKESVFDAVLYSTVGLFVWMLVAPGVVRQFVSEVVRGDGPAFNSQAVNAVLDNRWNLVLFLLVTPVVLSSVWYVLRFRLLHRLTGIDHPIRTAWDYALKKNRCMFVLCTLKTGERIGGLFSGNSFAATHPHEPELYIEELWKYENGEFVPVENSKGAVIRTADCKLIEFIRPVIEGPEELSVWRRFLSCSPRGWSHVRGRFGSAGGRVALRAGGPADEAGGGLRGEGECGGAGEQRRAEEGSPASVPLGAAGQPAAPAPSTTAG